MNLRSGVLWGILGASLLGFSMNCAVAAKGDDSLGAERTDATERCRCVGDARGDAAVRINKALQGPVTSAGLEFTDQPLEEVVWQLQDDYGIAVQIDVPALDNAGLSPDMPISVSLRNVSLRSALRLMLQHQLTYVIRDEVLMITTPEEAEAELRTCVYDIRDLIKSWEDKAGLEALTRAITASVATQTWEVSGGEAQISPLRPGLLVITQTRANHEEIAELLEVVREMQAD